MQEKQNAQLGFVRTLLPWIIVGGAMLLYIITLNRWMTLNSLPYVASVAGWDWRPPAHEVLYFVLTYPIRWLPESAIPFALNLFSALCSALTLGLLARSVSLLPHDRTHAQRQRERSEHSLLSIPTAWLPPVFAVLVCGLQMTFWEFSVAAGNESLSLLVFAYVIRCLLEYRVDRRESWLYRLSLVYGLGVTSNWALIGFFPCFVVALIWIKGFSFFNFGFVVRMIGFGAVGLLLYTLLPVIWLTTTETDASFWTLVQAQLGAQKTFLLGIPALRSRALILSLTAILPLLIIGIRWPTSFGDTSAAGAALTNIMFRVIHITFLVACVWVAFDQKFSPRELGYGLPFLTFYYLGALSVGYLTGYVLLVSSEVKTNKTWRRQSGMDILLGRVFTGLVWIAFLAVPAGLIYKNYGPIRLSSRALLNDFAQYSAKFLPESGGLILSDDQNALNLVRGQLKNKADADKYIFVHTRSLPIQEYHRKLIERYPQRWPDVLGGFPIGAPIDDPTLLSVIGALAEKNAVYYLHPSFGYYFEHFYAIPQGPLFQLKRYPANSIFPPPLDKPILDKNRAFWGDIKNYLSEIQNGNEKGSLEARYLARFYSRSLNQWGVEAQKSNDLKEAKESFQLAVDLNTNNVPALINLEYNTTLTTGESRTNQIFKLLNERFGRTWEGILFENGPFDQPDVCNQLGKILLNQNLHRQGAIQFDRAYTLDPQLLDARFSLAGIYIEAKMPDRAMEEIERITAEAKKKDLPPGLEIELARLTAAAHLAKTNVDSAEKVLRTIQAKFPQDPIAMGALVALYNQSGRFENAMSVVDNVLKNSPNNVAALINKAAVNYSTKSYEQAFESLERALKNDPRNVQALIYKIFMEIESKDHPAAMKTVERVLQIDSENIDALLYQAVIHIEAKEYEKALIPLDRLLKISPNNWNAIRNRAIANLQNDKLSEAKKDYEKLQNQAPRDYVPYYGLGEIAYRQRNKSAAIKNYELYLKYVPENATGELAKEKQTVQERLRELKGS